MKDEPKMLEVLNAMIKEIDLQLRFLHDEWDRCDNMGLHTRQVQITNRALELTNQKTALLNFKANMWGES